MRGVADPIQAQPWHEHLSADAAAQARELAHELARLLRAAIAERGQALLAVSGGKSPIELFTQLRGQPLPWERVTVLPVDERCVPVEHPDSNAALVRRHLLREGAAAARWQPFFDALPAGEMDETALAALAAAARQRLAPLPLPWPLDVAVLGMGEDGHTASLFPGARGLEEALSTPHPVAWTRPVTAPHARLTLSLHTLLQTRQLVLLLAGARKRAVYGQACLAPTPALPVSLVLHRAPRSVQVWLAP